MAKYCFKDYVLLSKQLSITRLKVGSIAKVIKLGLDQARYSEARARLGPEKNGLVPPLVLLNFSVFHVVAATTVGS